MSKKISFTDKELEFLYYFLPLEVDDNDEKTNEEMNKLLKNVENKISKSFFIRKKEREKNE